MKAKELMIGDLLQLGETGINYVTVVAIDYDYKVSHKNVLDIAFLNSGTIQYNYSAERLYPIPLTAEILENNEFVLSDGWWINERFPTGLGFIGVAFDPDEEGRKTNTIYDLSIIKRESGSVDLHLNYVHELQHALRLCGIEKEITL